MRITTEEGKSIVCKEIGMGQMGTLSKERLCIMQLLSVEPRYPAEIAREMEMPLQTVYYHVKLLEKAGFIRFFDYSERNGGVAKRYVSNADSVAVIINKTGWKDAIIRAAEPPPILAPFVGGGHFDGLMVVGSPEPHGKYRARASELGAIELAMLFGGYAAPIFPMYTLDTQLLSEDRKQNLVLVGGPKVNTLVAEINDRLPIRYDHDHAQIRSTRSGRAYEGNIGVVELIDNPYKAGKKVLAVGGLNQNGTRAAVMAIVKKTKEVGLKSEESIARIVEGFDENGDGKVDAIEFLE